MRYRQAVLVAAAAFGLAGCGSSASTAAGTATADANPPSAAAEFPVATGPGPAPVGTGGFKATCPSTAMISSTLGQKYPVPRQLSGDGTVSCAYSNGTENLVVLFTPNVGSNGTDLKTTMDSQAKGQNTTDHAVPGLGDAAYEFSSATSGHLHTVVATLTHSVDIDLTAQAPVAQTEALARDILGS